MALFGSPEKDFLKGYELCCTGKASEGIKYIVKAAEDGNDKAQFYLGSLFYRGNIIRRDPAKAFFWMEEAAKRGNAEAQYTCGILYLNGDGVPANISKAFYWIYKSAERGHIQAQSRLGLFYLNGQGVHQDMERAFFWLQQAAEKGDTEAQYRLGAIYCRSEATADNKNRAFFWLRKAAEKNHIEALSLLADLSNAATKMSVDGGLYFDKGSACYKKGDYEKALEFFELSAQNGHAEGQFRCGYMYYYGTGTEKDVEKAAFWLKKSAENGNSDAGAFYADICASAQKEQDLAQLFETGMKHFDEKEYEKALGCFLKAAEEDHCGAQFRCGQMYCLGTGVDIDKEKGEAWLLRAIENGSSDAQDFYNEINPPVDSEAVKRAALFSEGLKHYDNKEYKKSLDCFLKLADEGDNRAQFRCAVMYGKGEGAVMSKEKSLYWFEKSAEHGNIVAQFNCAMMYEGGEGTPLNEKKALFWYEKAAEQGFVKAQYCCADRYYWGKGSPVDKSRALHWYVKAAEQNWIKAQFKCGLMYESGEGASVSKEKALYWYEKAAEQGLMEAQLRCGEMYRFYGDKEEDKKKALYWYSKAAEQESSEGVFWRDRLRSELGK